MFPSRPRVSPAAYAAPRSPSSFPIVLKHPCPPLLPNPSPPQIVEGAEVNVPVTRPGASRATSVTVDTSQILFIAGGAFVGLEDVVQERTAKSSFGFGGKGALQDPDDATPADISDVDHRDLIDFGLIPEFCGRFPVLSVLQALTEEQLVRVLTEPKDALCKQYQVREMRRKGEGTCACGPNHAQLGWACVAVLGGGRVSEPLCARA